MDSWDGHSSKSPMPPVPESMTWIPIFEARSYSTHAWILKSAARPAEPLPLETPASVRAPHVCAGPSSRTTAQNLPQLPWSEEPGVRV